ncbi:cytoplasmic protein [Pholiota molesta]|nr:cytoplasmic protein [Pholiota molesta]
MTSSAPFPRLTPAYILAFQFSSWYPLFAAHSIKSTVVRPLPDAFRAYLDADGVFVPEGSEDNPVESTLSDDEDDEGAGEEAEGSAHYAFPDLDARIRAAVKEYGGVFPKLNFSSPKDAAWLLPASSPLKCVAPADVYLLLKSSDFVTHDLSPERVFAGCDEPSADADTEKDTEKRPEQNQQPEYALELVLRKWYAVDRSREVRCFVRDGKLLGISQRDTNFYAFWNDPATQARVIAAVRDFWAAHIAPRWPAQPDYVFDLLLTRDLSRGHILDFNPYHPKTDPLLWTYDELHALHEAATMTTTTTSTTSTTTTPTPATTPPTTTTTPTATTTTTTIASASASANGITTTTAITTTKPDIVPPPAAALPILRVIDSAAHPAAARNAPAHQHNMLPFEALDMSSGRDIAQFAGAWQRSVSESMREDDDGDDA